MKISMTGGVLDGGKSGIGVYVTSLMQALITLSKEDQFHFFGKQDELPLFSKGPSLELHSLPRWAHGPLGNIFWQNAIFPKYFNNFDLLHIPTIRRVPFKKWCPLVVTVHDLAPFKVRMKYGWAREIYHRQIVSRLIHKADRVIAVSYHTKKDLMELAGYPEEKIDVIYPGIKQQKKEQDAPRTPTIVYVSRIEHPGKNHLRLIEAFKRFKKRTGAPHKLLLVGADFKGAEIVKKKASDDVLFTGYLSDDEVSKLYSTCTLMCYPSLYEGFGMPVIEAMTFGTAVLCSNNSSLREIAQGRALLVDPLDVESIAQGIEKALDINFQKKAKEVGPSWAKKFTWDEAAMQTMKVYQKVII